MHRSNPITIAARDLVLTEDAKYEKALVLVHVDSLVSYASEGNDYKKLGVAWEDAVHDFDGLTIAVFSGFDDEEKEDAWWQEDCRRAADLVLSMSDVKIEFNEERQQWKKFLKKLDDTLEKHGVSEVEVGGVWYNPDNPESGCATTVAQHLKKKGYKVNARMDLLGCEGLQFQHGTSVFSESFSYDYKAPRDEERLIYDFYLFDLYKGIAESGKYFDKLKNKSNLGEGRIKDLLAIIEDGIQETTARMHEMMIRAVVIAVLKELRHAHDKAKIPEDKVGQKAIALINYIRDERPDIDYDWKKVLEDNDMTPSILGRFASKLFHPDFWMYMYGGENWVNIAKALIQLAEASSLKEKRMAIDHAIDIEHNSGSILSKDKNLHGDGIFWINDALTLKSRSSVEGLIAASSLPASVASKINAFLDIKGKALEQDGGEIEDYHIRRIVSRNPKYKGYTFDKLLKSGRLEDLVSFLIFIDKQLPKNHPGIKRILRDPYLAARYARYFKIESKQFIDVIKTSIYAIQEYAFLNSYSNTGDVSLLVRNFDEFEDKLLQHRDFWVGLSQSLVAMGFPEHVGFAKRILSKLESKEDKAKFALAYLKQIKHKKFHHDLFVFAVSRLAKTAYAYWEAFYSKEKERFRPGEAAMKKDSEIWRTYSERNDIDS